MGSFSCSAKGPVWFKFVFDISFALLRIEESLVKGFNMFLWLLLSLSMASDTLESINVTDLPTLQKCFKIQPYTVKGERAAQEFVGPDKIQSRCTQNAVDLAKKQSDLSSLAGIAEEVRKNRSAEESLKIFKILVNNDKSLRSCDDMKLFKALLAGLSHPKTYPNKNEPYVSMASEVIKTCQKNSQFLSDIKEETENENKYVQTNLCQILRDLKIANSCK